MRPTVGRIVHFYDEDVAKQVGDGKGFNGQGAGPYAAIVTQAEGDKVYLMVFPPMGDFFVAPIVGTQEQNPDRYWCWPPREPMPVIGSHTFTEAELQELRRPDGIIKIDKDAARKAIYGDDRNVPENS